jgi:hypothetical protein
MESIDHSTYELMKEYLSNGGKILSFTQNIPLIDGAPSENPNKLMKDYSKQWSFATNTSEGSVRKIMAVKGFSIEETNPSGELYHQRRVMKNGELLFLVNSDTAQNVNVTVHASGKNVIRMDLFSGKSFKVVSKSENNQISFTIQLPPVGSALYFISNESIAEPEDKTDFKNQKEIKAVTEMEVKPENENVLVIDYLDLKAKNAEMPNTYFMKAMYKLYEVNHFPMGNPWQHKIQYKQDYLALDTFKTGSGFEVNYHFKIANNADLKDLSSVSAVTERPELWKVYLNGKLVTKSDQWWIDQQFYRYPIGDKIKTGENTITLKADRMSVHAELMPIYIVGNFRLNSLPQGFEISNGTLSKTGSWKKQGYPFYSQKVSYQQTFNLPKSSSDYLVKLNRWNGITTEVSVNGQKAGLISWAPYQINIKDLLKEGKNEVVVTVVGSLKNSFGYFYKDNQRSINGPGDWNTAPDKTPALDQYYIMDYGLFEPFSLIEAD